VEGKVNFSVQCSGFKFELREVDKEDLEDSILAANVDDNVDGIIVYFPVFGNRQVSSGTSSYRNPKSNILARTNTSSR
jgi:5,10-methylene-tetrahydrofolate dehydrogenase/methenyl tetrahydrofolate cyclohydrolase